MIRMPTFFIPHGGGPCFFMEWNPPDFWKPIEGFLRGVAATLPAMPRAILLVSAHWEEAQVRVGSHPQPDLIYDYYGFPPHTYELTYPAPGDPALADRALALLGDAGIAATADPVRGFDHGMFIPLKLMFPNADIPVVQLSLRADRDAAAHLAIGRALAPLRDEDVLIVGSGMSFHNMAAFRDPARVGTMAGSAQAFDHWLDGAVSAHPATRVTALAAWADAPGATMAHPAGREEHLLPLMVAAGAGADDAGAIVFRDDGKPIPISAFRFG